MSSAVASTPRLSVASALVELLEPWIGRAFQVPGAANVPFLLAWSERKLPWITALEEKRGLTMAEGHARTTGRLALMSTTSGPGATNLATGLLLALSERSPVFVVTGQTPRTFAARLPVQELDTKSFARELTLKSRELTAPEQLEGFVGDLLRTALDRRRRGPVLLAVPADLWHSPCSLRATIAAPEPWTGEAARRCAEILRGSERPLLIAGSGVVQAGVSGDLLELVELLPSARVATTPRALGAFPSSHPRCVRAIGFGGRTDLEAERPDLLLVLGSRLHEMSTNLDDRLYRARILHIDIDPHVPGHVYPAEGFCADLRVAMPELVRALSRPQDSGSRSREQLKGAA